MGPFLGSFWGKIVKNTVFLKVLRLKSLKTHVFLTISSVRRRRGVTKCTKTVKCAKTLSATKSRYEQIRGNTKRRDGRREEKARQDKRRS